MGPNKKRSRQQMESEEYNIDESMVEIPTKKRKVTINGNDLGIPSNDTPTTELDDDGDINYDDQNVIDRQQISDDLQTNKENINTQNSSSLQPQNLLNDMSEINISPIQIVNDDENDIKIEEKESNPMLLKTPSNKKRSLLSRKSVPLLSPALSHLSEGDSPLPKINKNRK